MSVSGFAIVSLLRAVCDVAYIIASWHRAQLKTNGQTKATFFSFNNSRALTYYYSNSNITSNLNVINLLF